MTGITRAIVRRALAVRHDDLPPDVVELARQCVLDTLGVALAGADDPLVLMLGAELEEQGGTPAAAVIGSQRRLPALSAALLNGTMAHALDYDDVNLAMPGHPSVAVLPAVLALAQERDAGGAALIAAFVAGYETACRVGLLLAPGHYDGLGFHATGTIGAFGAAAGCAHLLGLDEERTLHAMGIAATQAAGLKSMFGTMCKPLHAGRAAQAGLLAARLAARGFVSRPDSLECAQGFAATHGPDFHPDAALADPEGGFHIRANLFKYHAACYLTHAGIEAAHTLRRRHALRADDIAAVVLRVDRTTEQVCNIRSPTTGLEAKFSLRHTAAMALAGHDTASLDSYSAAGAADPEVTALRDRINVDFQPGWSSTRAELDIRLRDQTSFHATHDAGIPAGDVTAQGLRLRAKFASLAVPLLGEARAAELAGSVAGLDRLGSMRGFAVG